MPGFLLSATPGVRAPAGPAEGDEAGLVSITHKEIRAYQKHRIKKPRRRRRRMSQWLPAPAH